MAYAADPRLRGRETVTKQPSSFCYQPSGQENWNSNKRRYNDDCDNSEHQNIPGSENSSLKKKCLEIDKQQQQITDLSEKNLKLVKANSGLLVKKANLERENTNLAKQLEELQQKLNRKEEECKEQNKRLANQKKMLDDFYRHKHAQKSKISDLEDKLKAVNGNITKIVKEQSTNTVEDTTKNELEAATSKISKLEEEVTGYMQKISKLLQKEARCDEQIRELSANVTRKENEKVDVENQVKSMQKNVSEKEDEIAKLKQEISEQVDLIKNKDGKIKELEDKVSTQRNDIKDYRRSSTKYRDSDKEKAKQILCLQTELKSVKEDIAVKVAKLTDLEKQVESYTAESKRLQTRLEEKDAALQNQSSRLQEAENLLTAQSNELNKVLNDTKQKLESAHAEEKVKLEGIMKKLSDEKTGLEQQQESIVNFAQNVKSVAKYTENPACPLAYQLDVLLGHLEQQLREGERLKEKFTQQQQLVKVSVSTNTEPQPPKTMWIVKLQKDRCTSCGESFANLEQQKTHTCNIIKNTTNHESEKDDVMEVVDISAEGPTASGSASSEPLIEVINLDSDTEDEDDIIDVELVDDSPSPPLPIPVYITKAAPVGVSQPPHERSATVAPNSEKASTVGRLASGIKKHGIGSGNACLCGIFFANMEKLQKHLAVHIGRE